MLSVMDEARYYHGMCLSECMGELVGRRGKGGRCCICLCPSVQSTCLYLYICVSTHPPFFLLPSLPSSLLAYMTASQARPGQSHQKLRELGGEKGTKLVLEYLV